MEGNGYRGGNNEPGKPIFVFENRLRIQLNLFQFGASPMWDYRVIEEHDNNAIIRSLGGDESILFISSASTTSRQSIWLRKL